MLTRLAVSGFKNLIDTELRFGPLTCIAGLNGMGKSNIFDAIHFLSLLADHTFLDAAQQVRGGGGEITSLFTAGGDRRMSFDCDMIIPDRGVDDFNQPAEASQTFLNYKLALRLEEDGSGLPRIELESEQLVYIPSQEAKKRIGFPASKAWRESVVRTSQRRAAFIDMEGEGDERRVRLSSDKMRDEEKTKRGGGRPRDFLARTLPRTVLSGAQNADESRTAVLARKELRSWRILQLEPSALRKPDNLQAPSSMTSSGEHLPATLYRLATQSDEARFYAELSNQLGRLVDDVRELRVDRDDARRVLRLMMRDKRDIELPASSLSDGTLRFVALCVLGRDANATGVVCLEEPENGIHPERMSVMVELLSEMAVSTEAHVDDDNPLRQLIISTHSPVVAARVRPDQLIFADHRDAPSAPPGEFVSLVLRPMYGTWWAAVGADAVAPGDVLRYLGSLLPEQHEKTVYAYAEQLKLNFGEEP